MKQAVTHMVRRSLFSLPFDIPFGSCPSRAAQLQPIVGIGAVPRFERGTARAGDAHTSGAESSGPIQAALYSLEGETNSPQRVLQPPQEQNPHMDAGVELKTLRSLLVVEDEPDIAMALQDLLEFEGFHVDCVPTCRQAFSSIEQNIYHAVLLDLELPDGDGCSILEKLQVSHPSLPVIILTASNKDLGPLLPYARLAKPWKRGELCGILHRATGTRPSQR
jgi:CheY-like chemotaxis protein